MGKSDITLSSIIEDMFTRILTDLERRRIREYLKADGERDKDIQNLVYRMRKYVPIIRQDIDLLEKLARKYDLQKTR
jgi:hypothetical protein